MKLPNRQTISSVAKSNCICTTISHFKQELKRVIRVGHFQRNSQASQIHPSAPTFQLKFITFHRLYLNNKRQKCTLPYTVPITRRWIFIIVNEVKTSLWILLDKKVIIVLLQQHRQVLCKVLLQWSS